MKEVNKLAIRKIVKIGTSKGVTLPPKWLRKVKTQYVVIIENKDNSLTIKPLESLQ